MFGWWQRRVARRLAEELDDLRRRNGDLEARLREGDESRRAMLHLLEDLEREHRAIAQARREWVAAVDAMREPIFLHDAQRRILRANRAYLAYAGASKPGDVLYRHYWEVFPRRPGPLAGCLQTCEQKAMAEEELVLPDGSVFISRAYPIFDAAGDYLYSMHVMEDITERRRAEDRLRLTLAERETLVRRLDELATHDALTGLLNYRAFHLRLEDEIARSRRYRSPVSLLMIDIDRFKDVNDRHGHLAGDAVLRTLADVLQRQARGPDRVCRYGGEEISVILPQTTVPDAGTVAERMREAVAGTSFTADSQAIGITISIGIAGYPEDGANAVELVAAADRMLYVAKEGGRNRVAASCGRAARP